MFTVSPDAAAATAEAATEAAAEAAAEAEAEADARLLKARRALRRAVDRLEKDSSCISDDAQLLLLLNDLRGELLPAPTPPVVGSNRSNREGGGGAGGVIDVRWELVETFWLCALQQLCDCLDVVRQQEGDQSAAQAAQAAQPARAGKPLTKAKQQQGLPGRQQPPKAPRGLLSLLDFASINVAIEVVLYWGLYPCLERGLVPADPARRQQSQSTKVPIKLLMWGLKLPLPIISNDDDGPDAKLRSRDQDQDEERARRAWRIVKVLQRVAEEPHFTTMLLPRFLPDIMAAWLQLAFGYNYRHSPTSSTVALRADAPGAAGTGTEGGGGGGGVRVCHLSTERRAMATEALHREVERVGPRTALPALRQLLARDRQVAAAAAAAVGDSAAGEATTGGTLGPTGGPSTSASASAASGSVSASRFRGCGWLRGEAGTLMSRLVLRPGGVEATLHLFLGGMGEVENTQAIDKVAGLLAAAPKGIGKDEYVAAVAPQLLQLVRYEGPKGVVVARVVALVVGKLSESMTASCEDLVLRPLLAPFSAIVPSAAAAPAVGDTAAGAVGDTPVSSRGAETTQRLGSDTRRSQGSSSDCSWRQVSSEEEVATCMACVEKLLLSGPPHAALIDSLCRVGLVGVLFRLYCFCALDFKLCNLLSSCRALLTYLLTHRTEQACQGVVECLETVAGRGRGSVGSSGSRGSSGSSGNGGGGGGGASEARNGDHRFAPGGTGGAVVQVRISSSSSSGGSSNSSSSHSNLFSSASSRPGEEEGTDAIGGILGELLGAQMGLGLGLEGAGLGREVEEEVGRLLAARVGSMQAAEQRATAVADLLAGLPEDCVAAGNVFASLLERYLVLKQQEENQQQRLIQQEEAETDRAAVGSEIVAVMVAVMAEKIGPAVLRSGLQVLQVVKSVLQHEAAKHEAAAAAAAAVARTAVGDTGEGEADEAEWYAGGDDAEDGDEEEEEEEDDDDEEEEASVFGLGSGSGGLCEVCLGMLSTVLDMGEEQRPPEEEAEIRAMILPLQQLAQAASSHSSSSGSSWSSSSGGGGGGGADWGPRRRKRRRKDAAVVAELASALLPAILCRGLSLKERREGREALASVSAMHNTTSSEMRGGTGKKGRGSDGGGKEGADVGDRSSSSLSLAKRMEKVLVTVEGDLASELPPLRARGVVTLTRLLKELVIGGLERQGHQQEESESRRRKVMVMEVNASSENDKTEGSDEKENTDLLDDALVLRLVDIYAAMTLDKESYVYLAAIQGLATLAEAMPAFALPEIVRLFVGGGTGAGGGGGREEEGAATKAGMGLEQRLKLGEALACAARRCGDAMPKYAHLFVGAFVRGARERVGMAEDGTEADTEETQRALAELRVPPTIRQLQEQRQQQEDQEEDEEDGGGGVEEGGEQEGEKGSKEKGSASSSSSPALVLHLRERIGFRASCLSNLAEVCELLHWSLRPFATDLIDLAVNTLRLEVGYAEEAVSVRRGAAYLLSHVLRGSGEDVLTILQANLKPVYRALKRATLRQHEPDAVTRFHAGQGVALLDTVMRRLFVQAAAARG